MIARIGPLVEAGTRKDLLVLHLLGGALGGACVGLFLGFAGVALERAAPWDTTATFPAAVSVALVWTACSDLRLMRLPAVTTSRQTPGYWSCTFGVAPASWAWGFHLGIGLATRFPHQALLVLPLAAFLSSSLPFAIVLMAAYGFARALAVTGVIARSSPGGLPLACDVVLGHKRTVTLVVGAASVFVASSGLSGALSSL